jgi:hypothetical protein
MAPETADPAEPFDDDPADTTMMVTIIEPDGETWTYWPPRSTFELQLPMLLEAGKLVAVTDTGMVLGDSDECEAWLASKRLVRP